METLLAQELSTTKSLAQLLQENPQQKGGLKQLAQLETDHLLFSTGGAETASKQATSEKNP